MAQKKKSKKHRPWSLERLALRAVVNDIGRMLERIEEEEDGSIYHLGEFLHGAIEREYVPTMEPTAEVEPETTESVPEPEPDDSSETVAVEVQKECFLSSGCSVLLQQLLQFCVDSVLQGSHDHIFTVGGRVLYNLLECARLCYRPSDGQEEFFGGFEDYFDDDVLAEKEEFLSSFRLFDDDEEEQPRRHRSVHNCWEWEVEVPEVEEKPEEAKTEEKEPKPVFEHCESPRISYMVQNIPYGLAEYFLRELNEVIMVDLKKEFYLKYAMSLLHPLTTRVDTTLTHISDNRHYNIFYAAIHNYISLPYHVKWESLMDNMKNISGLTYFKTDLLGKCNLSRLYVFKNLQTLVIQSVNYGYRLKGKDIARLLYNLPQLEYYHGDYPSTVFVYLQAMGGLKRTYKLKNLNWYRVGVNEMRITTRIFPDVEVLHVVRPRGDISCAADFPRLRTLRLKKTTKYGKFLERGGHRLSSLTLSKCVLDLENIDRYCTQLESLSLFYCTLVMPTSHIPDVLVGDIGKPGAFKSLTRFKISDDLKLVSPLYRQQRYNEDILLSLVASMPKLQFFSLTKCERNYWMNVEFLSKKLRKNLPKYLKHVYLSDYKIIKPENRAEFQTNFCKGIKRVTVQQGKKTPFYFVQ